MKIFAALLVLSLSSFAQAQVTSTNESKSNEAADSANASKIWLLVGPGISNISNNANSYFDSKDRKALAVGAEFEIAMGQNLSVQTGVDYIQKGLDITKIMGDPRLNGVTGTMIINYLELPLLLKVKVPVSDSHFTFEAGPYAALAVKREMSVQAFGTSNSTSTEDFIRKTDFGARFGAGFEIPIQDRMSISIGANYDLGLSPLNFKDANDSSAPTISNRTFMAMVGLGFKI